MKKTDIAMIILIAGISVLIAYLLVNSLFSGIKTSPVKVKEATPITSEVTDPSPTIFNSNATNPTVPVTIGGSADQ